jgi:Uncharacterised nucleotidyltransferase
MSERVETLRQLVVLSGFGSERAPGVVDEPLAQAALVEQVAPLLGARIATGELNATPAARTLLLRAHLACRAADEWAARGRGRVLEALRVSGVPVMLLKGAALVHMVYRAPGRRTMADLDLLVPASSWQRAQQAMRTAGATAAPADVLVVKLGLHHERAWTLDGVIIDVHRRLAGWPLFRVDHAGLFARARPTAEGQLLPSAEDLLVTLALHAAQDGFVMPLRAVIDGRSLIARGVDPELVVLRAREWRAGRALGTWLRILLTLGLPRLPWARIAAELDPRGVTENLPRPVPTVASTADREERWRARWRLVRAHDAPLRPLVFLAYRGALRAYDYVRR